MDSRKAEAEKIYEPSTTDVQINNDRYIINIEITEVRKLDLDFVYRDVKNVKVVISVTKRYDINFVVWTGHVIKGIPI